MKNIYFAIKFILDKTNQNLGRQYIRDKYKIKEICEKVLNSEELKNTKTIFEYGAAVGGVIIFVNQMYDPAVGREDIAKLQKSLDDLKDNFKTHFKEVGLVPQENQPLHSEIVEKMQTVQSKDLFKENLELKQKIQELENKQNNQKIQNAVTATSLVTIVVIGVFSLLIKPSDALSNIEKILK